MRLIDADELMCKLRTERDFIGVLFADEEKLGWQRTNELVRVMQIVAKMPTHEKKG